MTAESLRVVHFSTADNEGGSGRAAYRIHCGLRRLGHVSRMLVGQKVTYDADVDTVHGSGAGRIANRLADELTARVALQYVWLPSTRRMLAHPWTAEADVFQLYNLHGGYFALPALARLGRRAPIVWRLSDMWPMTGHCAYSGTCERWKTGCGSCPDLGTYPPLPFDTTAWLWKRKQRAYAECDITVVAPSSWTEAVARASPLLGGFRVERIANGLDLEVFQPRPRAPMRELLGLPEAPLTIMFSAHGLDANPRKGGATLMEALRRCGPLGGANLLLVGVGGASWQGQVPQPIRTLGYITDDRLLAAVYACADMLVAPSVVENLPNNVLEALGCGVPVVAFDTGGMKDAVRHLETGYLARHADVDDLASGIKLLAGDAALRQRLGEAGRRLACAEFAADLQARRFATLYEEAVRRFRTRRTPAP